MLITSNKHGLNLITDTVETLVNGLRCIMEFFTVYSKLVEMAVLISKDLKTAKENYIQ